MARDLAVLAAIVAGQGRLHEAESLYQRALDVFQIRVGPDHYEVAVVLNGLGALETAGSDRGGGATAPSVADKEARAWL